MKRNSTVIWFLIAAALAAFIWVNDRYFSHPDLSHGKWLPDLVATDVTQMRVTTGGQELAVVRTNNGWQLQKPFAYPAQEGAITALLGALEKLSVAARLTAKEAGDQKNFGFQSPRATVEIATASQRWHFLVGSNTAPGDQVFVRSGDDGAQVVDSAWLQYLPHGVASWRDTALVSTADACDWIIITNGARVIELRRGTNQHWRMVQPLAARADSARITAALQQIATAQANRFVSDDAKTDLATYGLDPAATDIWLGRGTNLYAGIHTGKLFADDTNQIYIRRDSFNSVALTAKENFSAWTGEVNDFRDAHLLELNAAVSQISVRGTGANYSLLFVPEKGWTITGENFAVDNASVLNFVKLIAGWSATEFVKDVVTATDLEKYGLANPSRRITFQGGSTSTNVIAEILFGREFGEGDAKQIYVKRAEEDFIYALAMNDWNRLPENGWEFRSHRLWNFSATNVASVALMETGRGRTFYRKGTNDWTLGAGQAGQFNPLAVEETVQRLALLEADGWVARNPANPELFGLNTNSPALNIELKSGEKFVVEFGANVPRSQTVFAGATLDGERWVFVFPAALAQLVASYLAAAPSSP